MFKSTVKTDVFFSPVSPLVHANYGIQSKGIYTSTQISIVASTQALTVNATASSVCMDKSREYDHPDVPLEFRRRKKKDKDAKSKQSLPSNKSQDVQPRRSEGSQGSGSVSTRATGLPMTRQDWDHVPPSFRPATTINSGRPLEQPRFGNFANVSVGEIPKSPRQPKTFPWRLQSGSKPNAESTSPPQGNNHFAKKKPAPLKPKQTEAPLDPSFLATEYPQLSPYDPNGLAIFRPQAHRSTSTPATPNWLTRDLKRAESTHAHLLPPLQPTISNPERPVLLPDFADDTDFALFVAATSGLSPDQPFARPNTTNSMAQSQQPFPPPAIIQQRPSTSTTSTASSHHTPATSSSSSRQPVEEYASPIDETPSTIRALAGLAGLPSPSLDQSHLPLTLPPSEPQTYDKSKSTPPALPALNPLRRNPPTSPPRPNWQPTGPPLPSPRTTLEVPQTRSAPWSRDNGSMISVNTTISRLDPSSARDGFMTDVSPVDSEHGGSPPPDYVASQREMAQERQMEATRRAEELQRRWMQGGRR